MTSFHKLSNERGGGLTTQEKARLYRGKGGEQMREGVCLFAAALADVGVGVEKTDAKGASKLFLAIVENVRHPNEDIQRFVNLSAP